MFNGEKFSQVITHQGNLVRITGRLDSVEQLPPTGSYNQMYLIGAEDATRFKKYLWNVSTQQWDYKGVSVIMDWDDKQDLLVLHSSGTAAAQEITEPRIPELYEGLKLIIIPSANLSASPTLNINGLGAIPIKRRNNANGTLYSGARAGWLAAEHAYTLVYSNGNFIVTEFNKVSFTDTVGFKHDSTSAAYGAGSKTNYGHVKLVNDFEHSTYADGEALAASVGYKLITFLNNMTATSVAYDATSSKLTATNVQDALDELAQKLYAVAGMTELTWANVQKIVRSGLAQNVFSVGDQLICNHTKFGELVWDIIDFDHDVPTDTTKTHSMSLQLHNPVESIMFDAAEAFYYAENGLAAGTYYTTLPAGYEEANGGGKSYYFTLPSPIPAGGQLRFGWSINKNAADAKIVPYADQYTRQETYISVTEGTQGTYLAFSNYIRPARFGSNHWRTSSVRKWLNSAAAANSWWEPQSNFDRPTPDASKPGFLNGMDADFLAVIGTVTKRTVKNNEIGGGYEDLTEKIFLPSRSEVFGGNTLDSITYTEEGAPYAYYDVGRSSLTKPGIGADTNRIHYKTSGTATAFWLRSGTPHNSPAGNVVLSTGGIGYGSYAYGNASVAPICNVI